MRFSKLLRSSGHRCLTWFNKGCTSIPRQWKCELSRWIFTRSQLEWDQVDPRVAKAPCSERECCWWRHRPCVFQQDEDLTLAIPSFGKLLHSQCWNDKIHNSPGCWGALWSPAHQPHFFPSPHIQRENAAFFYIQTLLLMLLKNWSLPCSEEPALAEHGAARLMQAGTEDVLLSSSSRLAVTTLNISSRLWVTHLRMTRWGVLVHACITFLKSLFSSWRLVTLVHYLLSGRQRQKLSVSLTWSLAGKTPTFDFPEAVCIILKLH